MATDRLWKGECLMNRFAFAVTRSTASAFRGTSSWPRMAGRWLAGVLALLICVGGGYTFADGESVRLSPVARDIRSRIKARQDDRNFTCQGELICGIALIPAFYAARGFEPAWSQSRGPTRQAREILEAIRNTDSEGLLPDDYHDQRLNAMATRLETLPVDAGPEQTALRADFDLLMTDAVFLLSAHILGGRVNPETIHGSWSAFSHEVDLIELVTKGLQEERLALVIKGLHPPYAGYTGVRRALAEYRRMAAAGGWPRLPEGPSLHPGDDDPAVARLRERLAASGDIDEAPLPPVSPLFDAPLEVAVKAFQRRHGLEADGVVGKKTRQALNVPLDQRVEQLLINMERWRWIPNDLGPRYLAVNIADFKLTMVDEGRFHGAMRVVVGRAYRKTPVFSGTMTYLDFNPYWNVPRRLAIEDILPRIQQDPDYIQRQGIRIFSGWSEDAVELSPDAVDWAALHKNHFPIRLQQAPGPRNALGRVKFMFPNKYAVYLHDTPARGLFNSVSRSFSSGCIRVEDPATLAEFVLEGTEGWDRARIEQKLADGERQVIRLQRPIPIHLLYWTAWSDESGAVHFRKDIYKRDAPLLRALNEKPAPQVWRPATELPGAHPADVHMDEVGFRIIADPAPA